MIHGLARLGSAALAVAEFAIVLLALLLLGVTTIPTLVRIVTGDLSRFASLL